MFGQIKMQKTCPKCFRMLPADVNSCPTCGADLSAVEVKKDQGKRNIFGYVPTEEQVFEALGDDVEKKEIDAPINTGFSFERKEEFHTFALKKVPVKPWA